MANEIELKKERIINALNKDFNSLKKAAISYAQAYSSGSFSDFNEASPGMAMLELNAFIGDILCQYIDNTYNELRDSTARLPESVQSIAKMRGYRPSGKRAARGKIDFAIEVPSSVNSFGEVIPDDLYTPKLMKGSQATAQNGTPFETLDDINFTASLGREVTGSRFDQTTGLPTHFALKKSVECISGRTVSETFTVTDYQQFRKIELGNTDVIEIIDVFDSQGNEWFEVDYLAQDWVFTDQVNENDDSSDAPYVLKVKTVPRRFISDRDITTGITQIVFGSGDGNSFDDEYVPNVADFSIPIAGRRTYSYVAIDPQNFMKTRSLGLSPHGTTLTVRYRVGGGPETNVPEKTIRQVSSADLVFSSTNLNTQTVGTVVASIGCNNPVRMQGGSPAETVKEMKINSSAFFAAQGRAVTREDIASLVLSMPQKFGKPEKVFIKPSQKQFSYDVHIAVVDSSGNLSLASTALKNNVKTFLNKFKLLTDTVNILDTNIIDIKVEFGIKVAQRKNRSEILNICLNKLLDYFDIDNFQIGSPIIISDIISFLQNTPGVVSVYELEFKNTFGISDNLEYSNSRFDLDGAKRDGMIICPTDSIFNVRFPRKDIIGAAK